MTQMQDLLQKFIDAQVIAAEANRMAVLAAEASKKAIEENTRETQALSRAMLLHVTKQENFETLVTKHETVLYGTNDRKGYLQRFDIIEDKVMNTLGSISKSSWIMTSAILAAVAIWLWQTFIAGLFP